MLGLANVAPFLLRRPAVYEVAIAGGYCCLLAGLYLTLTGRPQGATQSLAPRRAAASRSASPSGARPNLILAIPIWIWAWHRAWAARDPGRAPRRAALAAAALGAARRLPASLLAPLQRRALRLAHRVRLDLPARRRQHAAATTGSPSTGSRRALFSYLLAPPRFDLVFPFAHLDAALHGRAPGLLRRRRRAGRRAARDDPLRDPRAFAAPAILAGIRRRTGPGGDDARLAPPRWPRWLVAARSDRLVRRRRPCATRSTSPRSSSSRRFSCGCGSRTAVRPPVGASRAPRHRGVARCASRCLFALAFSMTGYYDGLRSEPPGNLRSHRDRLRLRAHPRVEASRVSRSCWTHDRRRARPPPTSVVRLAPPGRRDRRHPGDPRRPTLPAPGTASCPPTCANPTAVRHAHQDDHRDTGAGHGAVRRSRGRGRPRPAGASRAWSHRRADRPGGSRSRRRR